MTPPWGRVVKFLGFKQQSCEIFVGSFPKGWFKVQRTEILLGFGALHLKRIRIKFATNIMVRCTFLFFTFQYFLLFELEMIIFVKNKRYDCIA